MREIITKPQAVVSPLGSRWSEGRAGTLAAQGILATGQGETQVFPYISQRRQSHSSGTEELVRSGVISVLAFIVSWRSFAD